MNTNQVKKFTIQFQGVNFGKAVDLTRELEKKLKVELKGVENIRVERQLSNPRFQGLDMLEFVMDPTTINTTVTTISIVVTMASIMLQSLRKEGTKILITPLSKDGSKDGIVVSSGPGVGQAPVVVIQPSNNDGGDTKERLVLSQKEAEEVLSGYLQTGNLALPNQRNSPRESDSAEQIK